MLQKTLDALLQRPGFDALVAAQRVLPAQPPRFAAAELRPDLRAALERLGIQRLYAHQAAALRAARAGRNVVVATPTASGKSLCFHLPVLERVLASQETPGAPPAHALYLFPLKALEQDQRRSLQRLQDALGLRESFRAAIYDGDTPEAERRRLRADPPHLLLSNPDMLHAALLPGHAGWARFFAGLRAIVLDELHAYRGVFGSHVLHVLRRLRRVAAHYGAAPQVLAASATIDNPGELAERLFGLPFEVIEDTGAPTGPRHVWLLDPPDSPLGLATTLFCQLVGAGIKTIAFCKSRRATELLFTWAVDRHPELRGRVSAYRSGYLAEERRQIESELFGGHLTGVVATSALEMGIDVGGLDAAILVGYPGSVMSTWQRAGRAGRGTDPAAVFLVAGQDALDQYWLSQPGAFFRARAEAAVVDATNDTIRGAHLLCAGAELPLARDEPAYSDFDWDATRNDLVRRGLLLQSVGGDAWVPLSRRPHREVDIRQIGETWTIHPEDDPRRVLGTVGGSRAFAECHEGAIYLHRGRHYEVRSLDLERRRIGVVPADGSVFTAARSAKQTEILETFDARLFGRTRAMFGRLRITQRITAYERRATRDLTLLGVVDLDLPPTIYETQGLWIELDDATVAEVENAGHHRMGSFHGIEHAFIGLSPLFTLCDAADLGGITFTEHPQVGRGAIFIYDTYPGGIGLAARTYEILPRVLEAVRARIEACDCAEGCPACVHSPRCGSGNHPLDKQGSRRALARLLSSPAAEVAPAEPVAAAGSPVPPPATVAPPTAAPPAPATAPVPQAAPPALVHGGKRILHFDLETRWSAADVGGWGRIDRMGLALAVTYDEAADRFETFHEKDSQALVDRLVGADLVVGFNVLRFDYRVLSAYTNANLERIPTFDLLVELQRVLGFRLSLDAIASATLGVPKSADGLQSLRWVREGRLDRVEAYCRQDVVLTRDVFRYALAHRHLVFERDGVRLRTPPLEWELDAIVRDAARMRAARLRDHSNLPFEPPAPRPRW